MKSRDSRAKKPLELGMRNLPNLLVLYIALCHFQVCGGRRYFVPRAFNHGNTILISDENDGSPGVK